MGKYPLEPLVRVRAGEVDDAARRFADAVRAREKAEAQLAESRAAEARFLEVTEGALRKEALALASGVLRAADLAQGEAYKVGATLEHRAYADAVRAAEAALQAARAGEEEARAALAEKKAQADAVERDRQKFVAKEKRVAEAKEDEAAEERIAAAASRAQGGGRS